MVDGLTPRQTKALSALLQSRDTRSAAKMAGVAERTIWRWMQQPAFQAALRAAESEVLDAATRRLAALQSSALDTIEEALRSYNLPLRLQAAKLAFEYLLRMRALRDVEERLNRLEAALYGQEGD